MYFNIELRKSLNSYKIQRQNHENHENLIIPLQNLKNHVIH